MSVIILPILLDPPTTTAFIPEKHTVCYIDCKKEIAKQNLGLAC